jgi:hypothetical protein
MNATHYELTSFSDSQPHEVIVLWTVLGRPWFKIIKQEAFVWDNVQQALSTLWCMG